jgi:hypothetical protein
VRACVGVEQRIHATWQGQQGQRYHAEVRSVNADGTYVVVYQDGDIDKHCSYKNMYKIDAPDGSKGEEDVPSALDSAVAVLLASQPISAGTAAPSSSSSSSSSAAAAAGAGAASASSSAAAASAATQTVLSPTAGRGIKRKHSGSSAAADDDGPPAVYR